MFDGIEFIFRGFLRQILGLIDGSIYTIAAEIYGLMLDIAEARIFEQTTLDEMASRIYQLLGLIMLFKLIFSFLTYVVNPEAIADKTKGLGNIIKKIIISLGLIVITPWAFMQSRNLQAYVIQDGLIEYFITGQATIDEIDPGYKLMFTTAKLFITPHKCGSSGCHECEKSNGKCIEYEGNWEENINYSAGGCCFGAVAGNRNLNDSEKFAAELGRIKEDIPSSRGSKYDLYALTKLPSYGDKSEPDGLMFYVNLKYPLVGTTLVGIAIVYMLLIMCIDIAVRSVKLAFYEIISPIPIVSYIGFKDGKDSMLSKWFSQVLKTYADLFTRVLALQFSVYFIGFLINNKSIENYNMFVSLFLIIGALTFVKQFPNILKDLGINFEGGGFNLKKKLNEDMAGSKLIKRAGAAGLGFAGGAVAATSKKISNAFKDRKANQDLRDEMAAQGYDTSLKKRILDREDFKNSRNQFYRKNANNAKIQAMGSTRTRQNYAGSAQNRSLRIADEVTEHTKNQQKIDKDRAAALKAPGLTNQQRDNINAEFNRRKDAETARHRNALETAGSKHTAEREFKQGHATEYGPSVVAGAVSAATHAATSKDGKMFAGAREGIKESVGARELRDKRQEAGYDTITRVTDNFKESVGIDPVRKTRANELRDEISKLNTNAYAYQQQASASLQNATSLQHLVGGVPTNITQQDIATYLADPKEFARNSGMTNAEITLLDQSARAYDNALRQKTALDTQIAKANKKLGLYEKEQK